MLFCMFYHFSFSVSCMSVVHVCKWNSIHNFVLIIYYLKLHQNNSNRSSWIDLFFQTVSGPMILAPRWRFWDIVSSAPTANRSVVNSGKESTSSTWPPRFTPAYAHHFCSEFPVTAPTWNSIHLTL